MEMASKKAGNIKKKNKKDKIKIPPFVEYKIDTSSEQTLEEGLIVVAKLMFPEYSQVAEKEFEIKKQTDGLSNILYRITVYNHKFLIRVYGRKTKHLLDRDGEIRKQVQLSKLGLAADFYGKFCNGCCYEYLDGVPLLPQDTVVHYDIIAKEMARWHSAIIEDKSLSGEDVGSLFLIRKWLKVIPQAVFKRTYYSRSLLLLEIEKLIPRLIDSPKRFCHNDVLAYNIIYNKESNPQVRFIDYEYGGHNPRGFDLGNHFCEHTGFEVDYTLYPRKEQQMKFIHSYLKGFYGKETVNEEEAEHVYVEANHYSLVSHFMWSVWALYQAGNSSIDFDFAKYANKRLALYFLNRDSFLNPQTKEFIYVIPPDL